MLKSTLLAGAFSLVATAAFAQTAPALLHRHVAKQTGVIAANGRCNGVSYGTGARRCGSASGGPSGGLSNRN